MDRGCVTRWRKAEQDSVAPRGSKEQAACFSILVGMDMLRSAPITLHGPSCPCFSAATCDQGANPTSNEGELEETPSLPAEEKQGNSDLNYQLPQYTFVFDQHGKKSCLSPILPFYSSYSHTYR